MSFLSFLSGLKLRRARARSFTLGIAASMIVAAACGGGQDFVIPPEDSEAGADGATSDGAPADGSNDGATSDGGVEQDANPDGSINDGEADATVDASVDGAGDVTLDGASDGPTDALADGSSDSASDATDGASIDATTDGATDASVDAGPDASADASDGGGCPAPDLVDADRHLFVDKSVVTSGNGSQACPFKTILEATAIASVPPAGSLLTIHVRGTGATLYDEAGPVVIGARTVLTSAFGAGAADPALVTIRAQGTCSTEKCAVRVLGGTLDGLTIDTPNNVSDVNGVLAEAYPKLQNVTVAGATGSGIYAMAGGAEIGPGVYSSGNGVDGLRVLMHASQKGTVLRVVSGGRGNRFNANGRHGVHVLERYGHVEISDVRANNNNSVGLYIEALSDTQHLLEKIEAKGNTVVGLRVLRGPAAISGSVFDENGIHGVFLGNGNNDGVKFSILDASASNNGADGVRLDTSDAVDVQQLTARGNGKSAGSLGGGSGVLVGFGTSLKLRKSVLLGNTVGLSFAQQRNGSGMALTTLDLGPSGADPGSNTFAATPTTSNNTKAAVCILRSGTSGSQKAVGNAWTACPITQTLISGVSPDCYDVNAYSDVAYVPFSVGDVTPVDTGGVTAPACTVGIP